MPTIAEQLGDDRPGPKAFEFSNTRKTRPALTNIEVIERVAAFLRTGDARHLPPGLRHEAEGIMALAVRHAAMPGRPWPPGAAHPHPGPGASAVEIILALVGDRADDDSSLEDGEAAG